MIGISLLLGACAAPAEQGPRELPPAAASAAFAAPGNVIVITVIDPAPLNQAELIAADGTNYPATDIQSSVIDQADPELKPQVGVVGSGGPRSGSDMGVAVTLPVFGWGGSRGALRSEARVSVPDMHVYRATWRLWQIRVRLGRQDSGDAYLTMPAPAPPG